MAISDCVKSKILIRLTRRYKLSNETCRPTNEHKNQRLGTLSEYDLGDDYQMFHSVSL